MIPLGSCSVDMAGMELEEGLARRALALVRVRTEFLIKRTDVHSVALIESMKMSKIILGGGEFGPRLVGKVCVVLGLGRTSVLPRILPVMLFIELMSDT